jgi:hypothetical protein
VTCACDGVRARALLSQIKGTLLKDGKEIEDVLVLLRDLDDDGVKGLSCVSGVSFALAAVPA